MILEYLQDDNKNLLTEAGHANSVEYCFYFFVISARITRLRVAITEKGQRVYSQSTNRKSLARIFSTLSKEDLEQFISYLKRLNARTLKEIKMVTHSAFPDDTLID